MWGLWGCELENMFYEEKSSKANGERGSVGGGKTDCHGLLLGSAVFSPMSPALQVEPSF